MRRARRRRARRGGRRRLIREQASKLAVGVSRSEADIVNLHRQDAVATGEALQNLIPHPGPLPGVLSDEDASDGGAVQSAVNHPLDGEAPLLLGLFPEARVMEPGRPFILADNLIGVPDDVDAGHVVVVEAEEDPTRHGEHAMRRTREHRPRQSRPRGETQRPKGRRACKANSRRNAGTIGHRG